MSAHLLYRLLVASLWMFWGGTALAQQCPPGQIAYGSGPGLNMCGPDNRQQQAPQQPAEQWERRWGAIATSVPDGVLGVSTDKSSNREASQTAISDCAAKGGLNCKIEIAYDNQCAAVVVGDGGYNAPIATTINKAVEVGMKTCRDAGRSNCHVYYSACSLPVRIR
ncbi:DUF4189 domain-containing protein [Variovorax sp. DXTD-1]|uniref:DUF4189 domain-containing protein n=1 Tax=Variovorax sp. DXTD-1 TaxID=2495592 RepID=UPI000F85D41B|nr:DUF4189 domain-containing protein [Variovorax sp. DXTD-1]RST45010.1 DUF4189 domain-containing protein [Variovorax sp. DXTD-1]